MFIFKIYNIICIDEESDEEKSSEEDEEFSENDFGDEDINELDENEDFPTGDKDEWGEDVEDEEMDEGI